MNAPAKFTQTDVKRAVKGVESAGKTVHGVEITNEGTICIKLTPAPEDDKQTTQDFRL